MIYFLHPLNLKFLGCSTVILLMLVTSTITYGQDQVLPEKINSVLEKFSKLKHLDCINHVQYHKERSLGAYDFPEISFVTKLRTVNALKKLCDSNYLKQEIAFMEHDLKILEQAKRSSSTDDPETRSSAKISDITSVKDQIFQWEHDQSGAEYSAKRLFEQVAGIDPDAQLKLLIRILQTGPSPLST